MILWLILTSMSALIAAYAVLPFLRPLTRRDATALEMGIFRDQLAEVDRELAAGLIDAAAADQARLEIKRRMLVANKSAASALPEQTLTALEYKFALGTICILTILGSAGLYAFIGGPGVPSGQPGEMATSEQPAGRGTSANTNASGQSLPDVQTLIGKLAERLEANPNDAKGWSMLGWSYFQTQRYAQSAEAFRKAADLEPKSPGLRAKLGEALVQSANGKVTPEAVTAFDSALSLDAKEPVARFFKGLAKDQAGDAKGAIDDWIAELKDAGPGDEWAGDLRQRVLETAKEIGLDVASRLPALPAAPTAATEPVPPTASAGAAAAAPVPGPTAADVANAQSLSPEDRTAMIRGMVDRLAQKLQASPRDVQGWIQLMRSRQVLGDTTRAKDALMQALGVFKDPGPDQDAIKSAAAQLGLTL
jgi:cytochrome c-type biogenesis protein CcmH